MPTSEHKVRVLVLATEWNRYNRAYIHLFYKHSLSTTAQALL